MFSREIRAEQGNLGTPSQGGEPRTGRGQALTAPRSHSVAERITDKLRSFYRRQEPFDTGELQRTRLGERRTVVMAAQDAPPPISVKRPDDADTSRGLTQEV